MNHKINHSHYFMLLGIALFLTNNAFARYPWIEIPPVSQAVPEGGTATLTVSMSGDLPITYTWHRNFEPPIIMKSPWILPIARCC